MAEANQPAGYTPLATFERHHAEQNARWAAHAKEHVEIIEKIGALKGNDDMTAERLKQGAQTFAKMQSDLEKLTQKIMWPIWKVALVAGGLVSSIAVPVIVLAWTASKYPDRGEFKELERNVAALHEEVARFQGSMDRVGDRYNDLKSSVDAFGAKLEAFMRHP